MDHVRYVQYINKTYRRSGTLWEGRFRSCLTQDETYVLSCYRYIERKSCTQAALQFKENETRSVIRIAAQVVESLVINTLMALLSTASTLLDAIQLTSHSANDVKRQINNGAKIANSWKDKSPSEHIILLKQIIHHITLGKREVSIVFSLSGLRSVIMPESDVGSFKRSHPTDDQYVAVKSVYLKRCGIETKLIVSGDSPTPAHPETAQAIQNAVAKALRWNDALINDQVPSIKTIAEQKNVTSQFITRRIKLAYLSPDIMEAIFKGDIPHTLSLGLLEKFIPLNWEDQRESFGFAS